MSIRLAPCPECGSFTMLERLVVSISMPIYESEGIFFSSSDPAKNVRTEETEFVCASCKTQFKITKGQLT